MALALRIFANQLRGQITARMADARQIARSTAEALEAVQDYLDHLRTGVQQDTAAITSGTTSTGSQAPLSFTFSSLVIGQTTNPVRVRTGLSPVALDMECVGLETVTAVLIDVQFSTDYSAWTSLLSTPASLAVGAGFITTITSFVNVIPANAWVRALVAAGSGVAATQVGLQLAVQ